MNKIDPYNSAHWNIPLIGFHSQLGEDKFRIDDKTGKPYVWGWSVWKRQGGYRTYGLPIDEMLARGWVFCLEDEQIYTGTGSDYLDCVLGIGGFEQYGPIKGVKGLTDDE